MRVTVADLKDQITSPGPHPELHCFKCGASYSANAGDYWNVSKDHVFKCCRCNMSLVIKRVVFEEVKLKPSDRRSSIRSPRRCTA